MSKNDVAGWINDHKKINGTIKEWMSKKDTAEQRSNYKNVNEKVRE